MNNEAMPPSRGCRAIMSLAGYVSHAMLASRYPTSKWRRNGVRLKRSLAQGRPEAQG